MRIRVVLLTIQSMICLVGCHNHPQLNPSFTIIEIVDLATGQKLANFDLSVAGIGLAYPGRRLGGVVAVKPTDDNGRTVIPVGFYDTETLEDVEFDVVIESDVVHVQNRPQFVGIGEYIMVSVLDTAADLPDLGDPIVVPGSLPTEIAIQGIVSQIILCSNSESFVEWSLESDIANGRFLRDIAVGTPLPGFIDTTLSGGFITPDGERRPPSCPFNVLNETGSTVGILGAFGLGEYRRSSVVAP